MLDGLEGVPAFRAGAAEGAFDPELRCSTPGNYSIPSGAGIELYGGGKEARPLLMQSMVGSAVEDLARDCPVGGDDVLLG